MKRQCSLFYGNSRIDYTLCYTERKTLKIEVYPDFSVVVNAPLHSDKHLNHNRKFYDFLDMIMPDWKKRKEKLEKFGIF